MKKKNLGKVFSAFAVLAISATAALSAVSFSACSETPEASDEPGKLITADKNHNSHIISTASGQIVTKSSGRVFYVTPEGGRESDGSSWDNAINIETLLVSETLLKAGDTVYVKPGTYVMNSALTMQSTISGEYNKYIRIVNAALEKSESGYSGSDDIVTLDFSRQYFGSTARGIQIYGNYIYWYGIDVCGAGDNGLYIGGSYNTVEFCEFYNNRDTGLQLGRAASGLNSIDSWPSYNLIKNCTSHNNYDNETYGENADGFAAKLTVGYGNVFDGCIAYRNSDDGWDLYAKSDSGNIGCVIIYNCVAFENGYLEYTQAENNARFANFNKDYTETFKEGDDVRYFRTRDGDGNGFKLGGSAMEGDVEMHNCLSFMNRMHGVTDNSNPGYLKVEGVTSYDNSAAIDENPESSTFGQIIGTENHDTHGNINVSRQSYSYNSVINTLSVKSKYSKSLENDEYRGSVTNSVLLGSDKMNVIKGSMDADSKAGLASNADELALLNPADVFKALPIVDGDNDSYVYNLSGLHDLYESGVNGALKHDRVHVTYRNAADHSINMRDILAKKDGIDASLISGAEIGSALNKGAWEDYTHFFSTDIANSEAVNENSAKLERVKETLTINTDKNAVYQDFEVPIKLNDCTIDWSSSDEDWVTVGEDVELSVSQSKYITIVVNRPLDEDKKVTITATITVGEGAAAVSDTKEFELTIKKGIPSIGKITVLTRNGVTLNDKDSYVVDMYNVFTEPKIQVQNGIDYHGKLLKDDVYTYTTEYKYATSKSSPFVKIKGFTPSNAGVYMITHTVKLVSDPTQSRTMTYTLYVSSTNASVDFVNSSVSVNRDGYLVSGNLTNATGMLYAVSTDSVVAPTVDTIKTYEGVESYQFRDDAITFQFKNANSSGYKVYYALANLNGDITSEVYEKEVTVTDISTNADFLKIAGGDPVDGEDATATIYRLTQDLDFNGNFGSRGNKSFVGLFNGQGHTLKNITVSGSADKCGVFIKVEGGTIENLKVENLTVQNSSNRQNGFVANSYGGYFHNIAFTNVHINGAERTGGLIGQVYEGAIPTYISQISVVNTDDSRMISSGNANRAGGIIGLIQATSGCTIKQEVYISDCYVAARINGSQQVGGIVGSFDNQNTAMDYLLDISHCYFGGTANSSYTTPRVGGILGYQPGAVGKLIIDGCISVGKLSNTNTGDIEFALKTASLIVGGYASTAENVVTNCIASMEEYNSDYEVDMYTPEDLQINIAGIEEALGEDYDVRWSFVYREGTSNRLQAPYLTLNFLDV